MTGDNSQQSPAKTLYASLREFAEKNLALSQFLIMHQRNATVMKQPTH